MTSRQPSGRTHTRDALAENDRHFPRIIDFTKMGILVAFCFRNRYPQNTSRTCTQEAASRMAARRPETAHSNIVRSGVGMRWSFPGKARGIDARGAAPRVPRLRSRGVVAERREHDPRSRGTRGPKPVIPGAGRRFSPCAARRPGGHGDGVGEPGGAGWRRWSPGDYLGPSGRDQASAGECRAASPAGCGAARRFR